MRISDLSLWNEILIFNWTLRCSQNVTTGRSGSKYQKFLFLSIIWTQCCIQDNDNVLLSLTSPVIKPIKSSTGWWRTNRCSPTILDVLFSSDRRRTVGRARWVGRWGTLVSIKFQQFPPEIVIKNEFRSSVIEVGSNYDDIITNH